MEAILPFLVRYSHLIAISVLCWATYIYTLRCGFCSDDIQGIAEYDGKLQGFEYGMLWRWARYHICGGNFPSKTPLPNGQPMPMGKSPRRHHILSIITLNITSIVAYWMLSSIIGPKLALMAIALFIVHPCTTQGVAWISGLAYPLSLLWISVSVLLTQYFYAHPTLNSAVWIVPLFCIVQFLAIHAIFATTGMICVLLLFLGYWQFAVLGALVSGIMVFDQVRKTVTFRVEEFKKQHMGTSTVFNWRKPIVAMKTFAYYVALTIAPMRMGLYHVWGFHYEESLERRDWRFWTGLGIFSLLALIFFKSDSTAVRLGILWYVIFSTGFWNWITAQQFVTERYIMVANVGYGIILACLLQNHLTIYFFLIGVYLCRTWTFLPTYDNELRFYQSNIWNFPKSEVAMGNLGVTYARIGLIDSAKDAWLMATQINPNYDVPLVNIFYQFRSKAFELITSGDYVGGIKKLNEALPFLEKALNAKVCHFPDQWKKEYMEAALATKNPGLLLQDEFKRLLSLRENLKLMLSKATTPERASEVNLSIKNNDTQIENLLRFLKEMNIPITDSTPFQAYNMSKLMDQLTRR